MTLDKLSADLSAAFATVDHEAAGRRPKQQRQDAYDRATPRVVWREPPSRFGPSKPRYATIRLAKVAFIPKHVRKFHRLGERTERTERVPDMVSINQHRTVNVESLGDWVRKPTAKALARIEAAEAAIRAAEQELREAERAAFTYGKPVVLSAVKRITRERREAYEG